MNNINGAALLARIRAGMLVTIRLDEGRERTGRAHKVRDGWCICSMHPGSVGAVTESNIVRVTP